MYEKFFNLRERPFELTPNPRFLFLSARHREALSNIRYGLSGQRGLTVLTGEAGTGKTTLLRAALQAEQKPQNLFVTLSNPTLSRPEFIEYLALSFRFPAVAATSKARFLFEMQRELRERHAAGGVTAVIVDEAQSLPIELLEEIRLLANLETATVKLLNVILVGQPELTARLNEPGLRQLKQRVMLRCNLTALDLSETAAYIAGRVKIAGGQPSEVFTKDAVLRIFDVSKGLPRTVGVLCENSLMTAFATETKPVTARVVDEVCRDFDLIVTPVEPTAVVEGPGDLQPALPESLATEPERSLPAEEKAPALFGRFSARRRFSFFQG